MPESFDDWAKRMMDEYGQDEGGDEAGDREPRRPKQPSGADAVKEPEPKPEPVPV